MDVRPDALRVLPSRRTARWAPLAGAALGLAAALAASAVSAAFDVEAAREASRQAVGGTPGPYVFEDRAGRRVELARLVGRPLVVSLVYTSCYGSCSIISRRLSQAVAIARDALGAPLAASLLQPG